jgi:formate hydrogenlyase subunit 3/multisubunit Na+/H+ antiporter MnhD subunit
MGGVAFRAPLLASLFLITTFATLAMPGSANFVGEFMILLGTFNAKTAIAVIAFLGVIAAAFYALRLFISSMHNRVGSSVSSFDLRAGEAIAIVPLVALILALAVYPQFGLKRSQRSLNVAVAPAAILSGAPAGGLGVRVSAVPRRVDRGLASAATGSFDAFDAFGAAVAAAPPDAAEGTPGLSAPTGANHR